MLLQERIPKASAFYVHASEVGAAQSGTLSPQMPIRVLNTPDTPIPEVQLLSNGRYHVMVTNAGGGYSRWHDLAVTRWREDGTRDPWGTFCYLRDVSTEGQGGVPWSAAHQPTLRHGEGYEAIFSEGRAEFRRHDGDFDTHTEIVTIFNICKRIPVIFKGQGPPKEFPGFKDIVMTVEFLAVCGTGSFDFTHRPTVVEDKT